MDDDHDDFDIDDLYTDIGGEGVEPRFATDGVF